MRTKTYDVPNISCGHCEASISTEVGALPGVDLVAVDLERKLVTVAGSDLDDTAIRAAIGEAGYEAVIA